jgi:putative ABC transport system substrate-binding protein
MNSESIGTKEKPTQKNLLWVLPILLLISLLLFKTKSYEAHQTTVAITQIVEHPSLDQERAGLLLALHEAGYVEGQNLKIIYQNAQGSSVTATQIAQKLVSLNPDVIVTISTPSAQSVLAAIGGRKIPLVFTAVTDPIGARLVKNLNHPGSGVTGVSDYLTPEPQLKLVKRLIPNIKNLGIIYNPGETNSGTLYQELQGAAPAFKIHLVAATASRTSEVAAAAQSLEGRVDAIYIPNDNTAVSAIESIVRVGIDRKLPVFAGDIGSVLRGAVGVAGYDRTVLGRLAGEKVIQILKNGYAQELSIASQHPIAITLNPSAAMKMGLELPNDLSSDIQWIKDI